MDSNQPSASQLTDDLFILDDEIYCAYENGTVHLRVVAHRRDPAELSEPEVRALLEVLTRYHERQLKDLEG